MRSESLGMERGEVRVAPDHAAEFALEEAEQGVDVVVVLVRAEEAEGAVGDVDVGPHVSRVGDDVLEVVFRGDDDGVVAVGVVGIAPLGPLAFFGRRIERYPTPHAAARGVRVPRHVQIKPVSQFVPSNHLVDVGPIEEAVQSMDVPRDGCSLRFLASHAFFVGSSIASLVVVVVVGLLLQIKAGQQGSLAPVPVVELMQRHARRGEQRRQQYPRAVFGGQISDKMEGIDSRQRSVVVVVCSCSNGDVGIVLVLVSYVAFVVLLVWWFFHRGDGFIAVVIRIVEEQYLQWRQGGQQCFQFGFHLHAAIVLFDIHHRLLLFQ
mmetsp:Transcript_11555/g.24722  ORF Transcript_11555/g.24722 Transcript_11555/m.24722 type:complete len:321 (+) Transcript_11555:786-1748(+)